MSCLSNQPDVKDSTVLFFFKPKEKSEMFLLLEPKYRCVRMQQYPSVL